MSNKQDLPSKLAKARHELEKAQARVADLEAQLFENQPIHSTLLNHENRYHRLLDSLREGVELIGFDWRYLYVNDAVAGHGRQSKEVLLGSTVLELYPGIENTDMFAILRKCMAERTIQHFETEFTFPDGTSAWFELSVQPVPEGIFILSLDITERKLAEETLRRSEMHFRSLVETAVDYAIHLLDTDGHVVSWNIGAERLKGYRSEEIIGEHFSRFFTPEDQQSAKPQKLLQMAELEGRAEDEGWRVRKDGSQVWSYGVITALRNKDGSLYGFAKISRDLTHHKRAEENIRKLHRTLGVLSDINQAILRIRHLPSLFEKACEIAVKKGSFRIAWIGLLDPETMSVNAVAYNGISDNALEKLVLTSNAYPIVGALRTGERLICNDIQNDPMWLLWREDASRLGCRSTVALPLIVAGEIRGTFNLHADEPEFFNEQEMRLIDEMAMDISFAIEVAEQDEQRRQAESAIKRYAQRMEVLHHIDRGIINTSSIGEVVQTALKNIRQIIPCKRASVGLFDHDRHEWYLFVVDPNHDTVGEGSRFPIEPGLLENFSQRQIEIVDDMRSVPDALPAYRQFIKDGLVSALHAHFFFEQQPLGALNLFASIPGFFTAEHQEIATEIANQLAIAIRQLQLSKELARHVKTVEETGKFLQTTLDAFPANTTVIDPDGKIITVNLPWKHFADENGADTITHYLGMNYLSVCDTATGNGSEAAAAAAAGIRAVIVGQQAEFFLEYSCHSPFEERWFMLRVTPFAESVPRRVVVAHINITERKRAEVALQEFYHTLEQRVNQRTAELQAAKERVEAMLHNNTDGILLLDTDHKIQQTNASFNSLFGCEWDEYLGKSLVTLIFAEDADKVTTLIQTVIAELHGKLIEIRALRKDGKVFDAELRIGLIKNDGLVGSIHDITERKAQERQLRYHASIQESVSDAVLATDMDFRIQSWNRAAEAIYGWSAAEAIGKPLDEIVQTIYESEAERARILQEFLERGAWQGEVIQRHRDGSPINILAAVNLFKDDLGQPFGVVSVNRDITERKRADDALSESENRFRRAILNAPFPIMIHADDGEVLHISSAWTEISGYTHQDIPTMTDWVDKAYRENSQIVRTVIDKVYALTGAQRNGEFRIWTKSGEERIWDFVSAPLALMPDGRRMVSSMAMDITERKHTEETLQKKMEEERQFQTCLMALHEIIIELTAIDELDAFYKRAVELGRERLGFERLAMFLYDEQDGNAVGTFGTDTQGNLVDERGVRFKPDPNGIIWRSFERAEGFYFNEQTTLYSDEMPVGQGWNAAAVLWNGARSLGWFVADNLLSHVPASKPLLDVLGFYALSVGSLLAQKQTKIALQESERLYRLLADNINDLVMHSTLTGECLYISPSVQTLLGYLPEELIGQQTFDLIHPDDKSTIREAYASALARHDLLMPHQYRARHKDGHYVWFETVGKPLFSETSDEVLGVISSSRDITARRQSEEALRQSQQMLSNVIENIPVRLFWKDRDSVYRGCNTLYARGSGLTTPDEIIGKTDFDFYPERAAALEAEDRQAIASGQSLLDVEEFVVDKDGSAHWLRSNRVPLRSADGEVTGVLVTFEDITKRKAQERQLRFYASIQESVTDAVIATDLNFRIQSWNRAAEQMYGWQAEEVIGKFSGEILQTQFLSGEPREQAMQTLQEQGYVVGEAIQRHKDGRTIYTFGSVMLIKDETRLPIGFVAVNHDITKNKRAEEALQQALIKEKELGDLKTRFVSMASHEFRTPLAAILATTDTLKIYRAHLDQTQVNARLDKIRQQVMHMKSIMEDVLQLARIQAGRLEINPSIGDLGALCREIIEEFNSQPEHEGRILFGCAESTVIANFDNRLMRQVISNLISNALKYSPQEKSVQISLTQDDTSITLTVKDEGIGIPAIDTKHLFEPFHRGSNVGAISGTGLGLSITKQAVEMHDGTIDVETKEGTGTTFIVSVPRVRALTAKFNV